MMCPGTPGYEENSRLLEAHTPAPEILTRLEELRKALPARNAERGPTDDEQRAFYDSEADESEAEAESLDIDTPTTQRAQAVHSPASAFTYSASPTKVAKLHLARPRTRIPPVKMPLHHVRRSVGAVKRAISGESCGSLDSFCADPSSGEESPAVEHGGRLASASLS
jgi:hypothetical protein